MAVNQGISLQDMQEVVEACRTKFKESFVETQDIRKYTIQRLMIENAADETPEHGWEWTIRVKAAQGSVERTQPYQDRNYVRHEYTKKLKVEPASIGTHGNMQFTKLAEVINEGGAEKLWSDYKAKASAAEETKAQTLESLFLNAPTVEGNDNEWLGLLYWYRRSMTAGGVFVEQLKPARNGIYYVDGSGTPRSTMATQDASTLALMRLRTLCATHRGSFNDTLINTLEDCVLDAGFEYLDELKGDKTTLRMVIMWDDDFERAYTRYLTKLGAPLSNDARPRRQSMLSGVRTMPAPYLNNHFLRPIFGINLNQTKLRKRKNGWDVEYMEQLNHNTHAFPRECTGQIWAEDPSSHGFLVHGEFETGT